MLQPGIRPGALPPFYDMGEYTFQDMCRDLLDLDPFVASCEIYGTRGQRQDGIDLLAHRQGGDGIDVGQCKSYKSFPPAKIVEASNEFLKHWDNVWSSERIHRFVLFVACKLDRREQQQEILRQKERYSRLGVEYEAWSAPTLVNKLRGQPSIVGSYLKPSDYWVPAICGDLPAGSPWSSRPDTQTTIVIQSTLASQLDQLAGRVSEEVRGRLDVMRSAWREGRRTEVVHWLKSLRQDATVWPLLQIEVRAKLICFEAGAELDTTGDVGRAKALADEARNLAVTAEQVRLRAAIVRLEAGASTALELLDGARDVDSLNFKASLLLELGRHDDALSVLDAISATLVATAETHRLRALVNLVTRRLSQAELDIEKASELAPQWVTVQATGAIIDYWAGLAEAAIPVRLTDWPAPIDWAFVKRDDESLQRRRRAARIFLDLADRAESGQEERLIFESWRLACLANDPESQELALDYAQDVLKGNLGHYRVIAWVVGRRFFIDLKPIQSDLERLRAEGKADISHILAEAQCFLAMEGGAEAVQLLVDARQSFEAQQAESLWRFWYIQSLALSGKAQVAVSETIGVNVTPELRGARVLALRALANETGDTQTLITYLDESYDATADPAFLLETCELKARQPDWHYIADRAESLVAQIETGDVLRLAAVATFNDRRWRVAVNLLDTHASFFPQNRLPSELRRLRILCQQALGVLPKAVAEAETLAREEPTTVNFVVLAQTYLAEGDLKAVALICRQLVGRADLRPEWAIQLGTLIRTEDRELSAMLWRHAVQQGLADQLVGPALQLGFELGLEPEATPLLSRLAELARAGRGGARLLRIEDTRAWMGQRAEQLVDLEAKYKRGELPIHFVAAIAKSSLARAYHQILANNASNPAPLRQPPLLIRHGGRPLSPGFPTDAPQWRLHIDVTATLLAEHLGILERIEHEFKPIWIPRDLTHALIMMREALEPPQPSRLEVYRQIANLVEQGSLRIVQPELPADYANQPLVEEIGKPWVSLFEAAHHAGGHLLCFLPIQRIGSTGPPSTLPDDAERHLVTCHDICEALREHGPLSDDKYAQARAALGPEAIPPTARLLPEPGAALYCFANTVEILADADLLRTAAQRFQIYIEWREVEEIRAALIAYEETHLLAQWLERLTSRVGRGIGTGVYHVIPGLLNPIAEEPDAIAQSPEVACLRTLLDFPTQDGDVVWIDDRYVTSYAFRAGAPIIGINEILKALVATKSLSIAEYYDRLDKLRAANVRFVPVDVAEILYQLRQAKITSDAVVETQALANLRRYVAACLVQSDQLQRAPLPQGAPSSDGEVAFLLGLRRSVSDTLAAIWASNDDDQICRAYADWVLSNLYFDLLGTLNITSLRQSTHDERYVVAVDLAGLISQAATFEQGINAGRPSARQQYFTWLEDRILGERFVSDPDLIAAVADVVKKQLMAVRDQTVGAAGAVPGASGVFRAFFDDLPSLVRDEVGRDTDFMASIGLRYLLTIVVGDLHFDPDEFWHAAAEAINGRGVATRALGSAQEVRFEPSLEHPDGAGFSITRPNGGRIDFQVGDEAALLLDSPSDREAVLRRNREWIDCPKEEFDQAVADIAAASSARQRIDEIRRWRSSSATVYYQNLHQRLASGQPIQRGELLPPSAEGVLRHYRLSANIDSGLWFTAALEATTSSLIHDENLRTAIERLAGFPAPLTETVVDDVVRLPAAEKRELIRLLARTAGSPVSKLHFLRLLTIIRADDPLYRRLARRILTTLIGTTAAVEFDAFLAILKVVNEEFDQWLVGNSWTPQTRLAMVWSHAHELFAIFVAAGIDLTWVRDQFPSLRYRIAQDTFHRDLDYWNDIVHPRHVNRPSFLLLGLAYALGDDASAFVDSDLRHALSGLTYQEVGEKKITELSLVKDASRALNGLGSFLGWELQRALIRLLDFDEAERFAQPQVREAIGFAIRQLADPIVGLAAWFQVRIILDDLPIDEDLRGDLVAGAMKTDFANLVRTDRVGGLWAIHTAALFARILGDHAMRAHLEGELVRVTKILADGDRTDVGWSASSHDEASDTPISPGSVLLEVALHTSAAGRDTISAAVTEFGKLLLEVAAIWPQMIPQYRPVVERLARELPIGQAQHLSYLAVRLRAD